MFAPTRLAGVVLVGAAGLLAGSSAHCAGSAFIRGPTAGSGVTRLELELDLRRPPELRGTATLHGTSAASEPDELEFLLNRALRVDRVVQDGAEVKWHSGPRLRSTYHSEARVVSVQRVPAVGEWSLRVEYSGNGANGTEGEDWMGILLLAPDELRMSVQTVFYPQVGADPDGPGVAPLPSSVRVMAPEGFEVYVPGKSLGSGPAEGGGTTWSFESEHPTVLSLFAAKRVRRETQLGDARVVTLLRDEHAHLAEAISREARQILESYAQSWGPIGGRTLGVCEIDGRGQSYNWASQGIITIDRHAFGNGVPVTKLAHEIAHLWWGQEVVASGRGERFLTESLAEYASWRYLAKEHGAATAQREIDEARDSWLNAVHERGADPALADVVFATPDYTSLAYAKGPLVLLAIERRIGAESMDALLRDHRTAAGDGATLDGFLTALRKHAGDPALVAPWIERAGHAHVALGSVRDEDQKTRGSVRVESCPARCPELVPATLEIGARWRGRSETITIPATTANLEFEAGWNPPPPVIELDPRGLVLGERGTALYRGLARFVSSEPLDGAQAVALGALTVRLRFAAALGPPPEDAAARIQTACTNAALAASSASAADKTARRKDPQMITVKSVRLGEEDRALCIAIEGTTPAHEHVLVVPAGFLDADGLPLPEQRVTFTTGAADPDSLPCIVSSEPANGARDVPVGIKNIRVVFSKPMRKSVGFKTWRIAELEKKGRAFPALAEAVWEDDRTLSWKLSKPLEAGRGYGLPYDERYYDLEGNELVGFELTFTTAGP